MRTPIREADGRDLSELLSLLTKTSQRTDQDEIHDTIAEILAQAPTKVMPLPDLSGQATRLSAWSKHVGQKIREFRQQANLTQEELADRTGIGQGYISRIERAEHSPSHKTLSRIAEALGVERDQIEPAEVNEIANRSSVDGL